MTFDDDSAELFIGSETEWDSEPSLSDAQQEFLLQNALDDDGNYTIDSLGAVIYLGLSWKLNKAAEYHEGKENLIFDHLEKLLTKWARYADPDLGASNGFELIDLEVGRNFDFAEV